MMFKQKKIMYFYINIFLIKKINYNNKNYDILNNFFGFKETEY